jgi:hypothetical protein
MLLKAEPQYATLQGDACNKKSCPETLVKDTGYVCNSLSAPRLKLCFWGKCLLFKVVYLGKEDELL